MSPTLHRRMSLDLIGVTINSLWRSRYENESLCGDAMCLCRINIAASWFNNYSRQLTNYTVAELMVQSPHLSQNGPVVGVLTQPFIPSRCRLLIGRKYKHSAASGELKQLYRACRCVKTGRRPPRKTCHSRHHSSLAIRRRRFSCCKTMGTNK